MNQHRINVYHKALPKKENKSEGPSRVFPKWFVVLFTLFSIYLVVPIGDVPLLGLSLSAPIFFFLAVHAFLKSAESWVKKFENWFFLAVLIWLGIASSFFVTEIFRNTNNFNLSGLSILIHYAYWMVVFVVTIYVSSHKKILQLLINWLGWAVIIVAILRWVEAFAFGRIGFWSGTQLFTQNMYGLLFSSFSPFAYAGILEKGSKYRFIKILGVVLIWSAAAMNGSRGSWIGMVIGLALFLLILLISRPRKFAVMGIAITIIASITGLFVLSNPAVEGSFSVRFQTLESLEDDKTYMSRQYLNQKSLVLFKESPIFGIGPSRYRNATVMIDIPEALRGTSVTYLSRKPSHNAYLGLLAENGLAGVIPLSILLLYLSIKGGFTVLKGVQKDQYWALYPFIAFVQMSVHFWGLAGLTGTSTWFLYGMVAGVIMLEKKEGKEECA